MTGAKQPKKPILIRLPLPLKEWLFSEAIGGAKIHGGNYSVPAIIVEKLTAWFEGSAAVDAGTTPKSKAEKENVCVRMPQSLCDSLHKESIQLGEMRQVRVTVPSRAVEILSCLHRQAQKETIGVPVTTDQPE